MKKIVALIALIVSINACTTVETVTPNSSLFAYIPDAAFEKALIDLKIDKDGLVNGRMEVEDTKGVTILELKSKNIKSLAGIEAFVDLKKLICSSNQLTTLDISKNTVLTDLECFENQLTTLDD
jgi:Leucine-rich repeat (LRR) protein